MGQTMGQTVLKNQSTSSPAAAVEQLWFLKTVFLILCATLSACSDTVNTMFGGDDVFYYDDEPCLSGSSLSIESCAPSPPFSGTCDDGKTCPHKGGIQTSTRVHHWCADSVGNINWPAGVDGSDSTNWGNGCDKNVLGVAFDSETKDGALWEIKAADYTKALGFTFTIIAEKLWSSVEDSVKKEEPRALQCRREFILGIADKKLFNKADGYFQPPHQVTVRHLPECEAFLHAAEAHVRPEFPTEESPMPASVLLFKLRPNVPKPSTAEEFGNTVGPAQIEALSPSAITADLRRVLPDFAWDGHHPTTHYEHGDITLDLRVDRASGTDSLAVEGSKAGWDVLRALVQQSSWVGIVPETMALL